MAIMDVVIAVVAITMSFFVSLNHGQDLPDIKHGCYFDDVKRALPDLIECTGNTTMVCQESCGTEQTYCQGETGMTVDFCRRLCRKSNLQYYALQAGSQCFCGGALSYPFQHTKFTGNQANCSYPCSGDANQTCGGDFKMEIYEFKEPVTGADCFNPGFVPNSYVPDNLSPKNNGQVKFLCKPGHMILGEPQLTCQTKRAWSPNELPTCKGIFPETTISEPLPSEPSEPPKTTPLTTTVSMKHNVQTKAQTSTQTTMSKPPPTEPPETTPLTINNQTTTSEPLPSEPSKPPKTTPLTTTVSMKNNVQTTAPTSTQNTTSEPHPTEPPETTPLTIKNQTTTSEPLPSEPSEPPKTTPLTTTKPPETFISHFFLLLGILVGVASSVITTVLIIFIVKSINRNGPHEATEPRNTKQNSSIVVNPVFNIGRSEEALSGGYNTNGPGREHSYEVNLRGL